MATRTAFGTVLRTCRTAARLTQEQLADRSGLSVRAIRNLEGGRTDRPQRQSAALLAAALQLTGPDEAALLAAAGHPVDAPVRTRCELPPDAADLLGRDQAVAALTRVLTGPGPRTALVTGGPGTGRTALAVHVAHRLRDRFPDGQLFADLDQPDGTPMPVDAVLGRLLRSLGVTDPPPGRDERAAAVRAELAARRVLVVLDNVAAEAQVRPLLTDGAASALLLTSRRTLVALPGLHAERLEPLCADCACRLLWRLAGDRMTRVDQGAARVIRSVADACAGLPLALHVAGSWLAARPHRSLADLAELLADEDLVLDRLTVADLSVRASIAAHVAALRPDEQRLLHRLADLDVGWYTPAELRHPLATAEYALRDGMADLAQAGLLHPADGGYRMNDLVRNYARHDAGLPRLRAAR